jgi:hypothetical protein
MSFSSSAGSLLRRRKRASLALAIGIAGFCVAPAAAVNTTGPDYHANCTAGYAVFSALVNDSPGAVGLVAQPPKQFGSLSDVGYYSRTNCS